MTIEGSNWLHFLWGKARRHDDYEKEKWKELQLYIESLQARAVEATTNGAIDAIHVRLQTQREMDLLEMQVSNWIALKYDPTDLERIIQYGGHQLVVPKVFIPIIQEHMLKKPMEVPTYFTLDQIISQIMGSLNDKEETK